LQPELFGQRLGGRAIEAALVGKDNQRQLAAGLEVGDEAWVLCDFGGVDPAEGRLMAAEEVFHAMRFGAPAVAHDADAAKGRSVFGVPVGEEIIEDGVAVLLGRVPGLHELVVEAHLVGGGGGGIGGEQHAAGIGMDLAGQGKDEGDVVVALADLVQKFEGGLAGFGAEDALRGGVFVAQIAFDAARYGDIVIDSQDERLGPSGLLTRLQRRQRRWWRAICVRGLPDHASFA